MKTTKTAFIKKAITAGMMVVLFIVSAAFSTKDNKKVEDEPCYMVIIAWENTYKNSKSQPVVCNVVYYDCTYFQSSRATGGLDTYYRAYYNIKERGSVGLQNIEWYSFKTRDQAIQKRRQLIAQYNESWNPLLIEGYTITCDE